MMPDATITNAVYAVKRGVRTTIAATIAAHSTPIITNLSMTEVFILQRYGEFVRLGLWIGK